MDTIEIDTERLAAGQRYHSALEKLGLKPHALLWAFDKADSLFVLVLVTPVFDLVGPFSISTKLFDAYRAAATPAEIDPFVVRLHSPKQAFVNELEIMLQTRVVASDYDGEKGFFGPEYHAHEKAKVTFVVEGLQIQPEWIYFFKHPKRDTSDLSRQWKRFSHNVDMLAA